MWCEICALTRQERADGAALQTVRLCDNVLFLLSQRGMTGRVGKIDLESVVKEIHVCINPLG